MDNPWTFGWTQLLTLAGYGITIGIAVAGFRTFSRWKREKLEERRIETALEALAIVYEARFIFDTIRSPMVFAYEYESMPQMSGDDGAKRSQRGSFYATLKRIEAHKDFFERAWKVQTKCTALFGTKAEETFLLLHRARREVEVSAEMLMRDPYPQNRSKDNLKTWEEFKLDVWSMGERANDKVSKKLNQFRSEMESLCRPIVDKRIGKPFGRFVFWKKRH